jgi:uncharacterized protein YjiS (DUF1127 family)
MNTAQIATASRRTTGSTWCALVSCWSSFQEWRERRLSEAELCSLSDSALMDMGVVRGEIEFLITHRDKRGVRSP